MLPATLPCMVWNLPGNESYSGAFSSYENPVFAPDAIIISSFGNMGKIAGEQLVKESNRIAAENSYPFETCCEEGSPLRLL